MPDLLVVTNTCVASDTEFEAYLQEMEIALRENGRFAMIMDVVCNEGATPPQRVRQSQWINNHRELCARNVVHTAFVIRSPFIAGFLRAIFLFKPPYPHVVVRSIDEARSSCAKALAADKAAKSA